MSPTNLIVLPCHSVYTTHSSKKSSTPGIDADEWILASFQKEANDHLSFIDHIEKASELIKNRDDSLLIISGGFTKSEIELSESRSYFNLGLHKGWFNEEMLGKSIYLEEFARDSYENVLFSLCRFYQQFNKYPQTITIVGFGFKEPRFVNSHLETLGYYNGVEYIGLGPDFPQKSRSEDTKEYNERKNQYYKDLNISEKKFALDLFRENPFGSKGSKLHEKKLQRDPWKKSKEISTIYTNQVSEPLRSLILIDQFTIDEALDIYNKNVKQYLPFVKN